MTHLEELLREIKNTARRSQDWLNAVDSWMSHRDMFHAITRAETELTCIHDLLAEFSLELDAERKLRDERLQARREGFP